VSRAIRELEDFLPDPIESKAGTGDESTEGTAVVEDDDEADAEVDEADSKSDGSEVVYMDEEKVRKSTVISTPITRKMLAAAQKATTSSPDAAHQARQLILRAGLFQNLRC